ncbi:unnamed protein product [Aphanomyces euteiches]
MRTTAASCLLGVLILAAALFTHRIGVQRAVESTDNDIRRFEHQKLHDEDHVQHHGQLQGQLLGQLLGQLRDQLQGQLQGQLRDQYLRRLHHHQGDHHLLLHHTVHDHHQLDHRRLHISLGNQEADQFHRRFQQFHLHI